MTNFKKLSILFLIILLVGLLWWIIILLQTFPKKYNFSELKNSKGTTAIVVLTGGKMRIEKGLSLLKKGFGEKLFISGVFEPSDIETKYGLKESQDYLLQCCISFGQKATNTIENAIEVEKWLEGSNEVDKLILVTSYYHLPRSMIIFEKKLPDLFIFPVKAENRIDLVDEFIFHFKLIISEYFKVLYTIITIK